MKKSFYEILEVSNSASQEAIDAVYLVLQKKCSSLDPEQHPEAAEQLKFIQIAYGVIGDPVKRPVYDKRLAKAGSEPIQTAPTADAEQPTAAPSRQTPSKPAAPLTDNGILITPVELIAQLKEANRNTGPRQDIAERLTSIATKPLVAAIVGLVFAGSMTYKLMQPAKSSNSLATSDKQGLFAPNPFATAMLAAAQKIGSRAEAGISYREYSAAVSDLAVRLKTYQASASAGSTPKLGGALEKLLDAHVKARAIWDIKVEHPDLFSHVDGDNQYYRKVLSIYPPAAQMAKPQGESGQNYKLDIDDVLNALWQEANRSFNDAKRLNSGSN